MIQYEDSKGNAHFSDLLFWNHGDKLAHCLAQYVVLKNAQSYIFLADIKTSTRYASAFRDAAKLASLAIKHFAIDLEAVRSSDLKWYYRSGDYSSYDPIGYEDICELILTKNALDAWEKKGIYPA